jgi:cytoskeletal protein RodZ
MTVETPSGDTTKIIPPPRRGPKTVDLVLAAVAGSLLTLLVIGVLYLGNQQARVLQTTSTPSPTASASASTSPSASARVTVAPTTAPSETPAPSTAPTATLPPVTPVPTPTVPATTVPTVLPTKTP